MAVAMPEQVDHNSGATVATVSAVVVEGIVDEVD